MKEVKMAKRFTDTEKWKDDWYLSLSNDYRIVWQWLLDNCNHAGICKPSINLLNMMCNTSIDEKLLIEIMSDRVLKINNIWFIPKFLKFQYGTLNSKKPAVISVVNELKKNNLIDLVSELFSNDYVMITEPLQNSYETIKDKDKDKDKDISINKSEISKNLDYPFNSDGFIKKWNEWKEYKKSCHKFSFKSDSSEKLSLNQLSKLSNNLEPIAIEIINQSIANGWKGFFEIKTTQNANRIESVVNWANQFQ
jgi:hypothetical protein